MIALDLPELANAAKALWSIPFLPIAMMAGSALGGLFGGKKQKPGMMDPNIYGMSPSQRKSLAGQEYGMLGGLYPGATPQRFWGEGPAWSQGAMGIGPDALREMFMSGGGGGGRVGAGGGAASVNMNDPAFQLYAPERLRQQVGGSLTRTMNAQTADQMRLMTDRFRAGGYAGDASSPAAEWMRQQASRFGLSQAAEGLSGFEQSWTLPAAQGRRSARMLDAQLLEQSRGRKLQANIARGQLGSAAAGRRMQGALGLAGLNMQGERMDLDRFGMLHGMNMDWQRPQAQQQAYDKGPNAFQRAMGGLGAGANAWQMMGSPMKWGDIFGGGNAGFNEQLSEMYPHEYYTGQQAPRA